MCGFSADVLQTMIVTIDRAHDVHDHDHDDTDPQEQGSFQWTGGPGRWSTFQSHALR